MGWERVACIAEKTMKNFDQCCNFFSVKDRHNEDALSIGEGGGTKDININHSLFFFFIICNGTERWSAECPGLVHVRSITSKHRGEKCQFFRKVLKMIILDFSRISGQGYT